MRTDTSHEAAPAPRVSVVIATRGRPAVLPRAVASALAQTLADIEVIAVVDGPDAVTRDTLARVADPRLRVHVLPSRSGQPVAINAGVRLARGAFTALLDDDDEWMPCKLETQIRAAEAHGGAATVVACRFLARTEAGEAVWPLRPPRPGERTCDYLFCRSRLAFGEGIAPTSTLFAPTELLRREPMREDLHNHCDLDWLVRVDRLPGAALIVPDGPPLAVWNHQRSRDRQSNRHDWRRAYEWISCARDDITGRAYAGFLLTWLSHTARAEGDLRALPFLLRESFRRGRPSAVELAVYAAVWGLPLQLRDRLSRAAWPRPWAA